VSNLPPEITLDDLKIYFQSSKSGGGDVDDDACDFKQDDHSAVIAFEEKECKLSGIPKHFFFTKYLNELENIKNEELFRVITMIKS
jgi:hypothetical protein